MPILTWNAWDWFQKHPFDETQIEFVEPTTGRSTALNPRLTSKGGWFFKSLCFVQLNLYGGSYHGLAIWGAELKHTASTIIFGKPTNWRVGFDWWMKEIFILYKATQSSQLTDILMVSLPGDAHRMIAPSRACLLSMKESKSRVNKYMIWHRIFSSCCLDGNCFTSSLFGWEKGMEE